MLRYRVTVGEVTTEVVTVLAVRAGSPLVTVPSAPGLFPGLTYVSSRVIKEVARLGGDVTRMVPAPVASALAAAFPKA